MHRHAESSTESVILVIECSVGMPVTKINAVLTSMQGGSVCKKFYKCLQCKKVLSRHRRNPEDHQCGEVMCPTCQEFVDPNRHLCYIQPIEPESEKKERKKRKRGQKRQRRSNDFFEDSAVEEGEEDEHEEGDDEQEYLFFDIEFRQDDGRHIANFLIVQTQNGAEWVFEGDTCVDQFGTWLLEGSHEGAIVIAHNLRGYDGYLIHEWFYSQFLLPKLILNGAKIMSMELESANIKFRDSLNFLPMPLKALPKTFGLTELKKGFFPHFFNRLENQH